MLLLIITIISEEDCLDNVLPLVVRKFIPTTECPNHKPIDPHTWKLLLVVVEEGLLVLPLRLLLLLLFLLLLQLLFNLRKDLQEGRIIQTKQNLKHKRGASSVRTHILTLLAAVLHL